jgi:hypothetical protein
VAEINQLKDNRDDFKDWKTKSEAKVNEIEQLKKD